eukprot:SAG11_NODE_884_length_6733_cov_3.462617_2_plen_209_part_00
MRMKVKLHMLKLLMAPDEIYVHADAPRKMQHVRAMGTGRRARSCRGSAVDASGRPPLTTTRRPARPAGAYTAAEHGARYFANVVNELSANPRMLIIHEVMGRDCGWLTAYTAKTYRESMGGHAQRHPAADIARHPKPGCALRSWPHNDCAACRPLVHALSRPAAALPFVAGFSGSSVSEHKDVHAVYIPEMNVDIDSEAVRLPRRFLV